jgi:AraC family transcriptional regulator of adaptative response / DNA-3-methyladenine glycosylase II
MSPTRLRREGHAPAAGGALRLAYRPPYDAPALLGFLGQRALAGVEAVDGLTLRRTLSWSHGDERLTGWLSLRFVPERHELELGAAPSLAPALGSLLQHVRQAMDLDADPALVEPALSGLPGPACTGVRLPGALDGFEVAVRVVLGQQVTVAAARTLARRLVERFGTPIRTPFADLDRLFPNAEALAAAPAESLGTLGIVRQRVRALQALAAEVAAGRIALRRGAPVQATLDALRALPGIGDWTAQVIGMRVLAWPDAFPATDIGVLKALGTRDPRAATALAEAWRPWRSYAVMRLWHSLETPA